MSRGPTRPVNPKTRGGICQNDGRDSSGLAEMSWPVLGWPKHFLRCVGFGEGSMEASRRAFSQRSPESRILKTGGPTTNFGGRLEVGWGRLEVGGSKFLHVLRPMLRNVEFCRLLKFGTADLQPTPNRPPTDLQNW